MTRITLKHPDGGKETHIAADHAGDDYATICGVATDGDADSAEIVAHPSTRRVTCHKCAAIWQTCCTIERRDFAPEVLQ